MESHYGLTDKEFENQFERCTLDPKLFTHEAHLRLAWIHIEKYGIEQAIKNVCQQLTDFTEAIGEKDKYNATVTIAAVKIVHHFKRKSDFIEFKDFVHENSNLMNRFKDLIKSHYSTDIFNSAAAKVDYLEPELLPFD